MRSLCLCVSVIGPCIHAILHTTVSVYVSGWPLHTRRTADHCCVWACRRLKLKDLLNSCKWEVAALVASCLTFAMPGLQALEAQTQLPFHDVLRPCEGRLQGCLGT